MNEDVNDAAEEKGRYAKLHSLDSYLSFSQKWCATQFAGEGVIRCQVWLRTITRRSSGSDAQGNVLMKM